MLSKPSVIVEFDNREEWENALPDAEKFVVDTFTAAWLFAVASGVKVPSGKPEVTIFMTDDLHIWEVNKEYRGVDKPTNVLSFPAIEEDINFTDDMPYLAGDVFLSLDTTLQEAMTEGKTLANHTAHLLIHSCLHLLGFDHETDEQAAEMEPLEVQFLAKMGIKNPYED